MENNEFLRDQFMTLREEIKNSKARLFWIVAIGLLGIPLLTYLASKGEFFVWLLLPYSVLVLIVMFLAEQSSMMRAGRFIREQIEMHRGQTVGWEGWIESRPQFRMVDKHFVACFVIVFFLYYFGTIGTAVDLILKKEATDMSGNWTYWYWLGGAVVTYAIGAIWAFSTLVHHWRSSVSTSVNDT
ncbi:MAG: hypothetical protein V2A79_14345 [Planctomycetota bacterium]